MRWEPWTGCYKISDGCTYCYFYGLYSKRHGQNTIVKTEEFYKPLGLKPGITVDMCFATDFFLQETDEWRKEAWNMIKQRPDLNFMFITKRIDRFNVSLPDDWGSGYENVMIGCTVENQEMADYRLPLFLSYPIKHRFVCCSPLLTDIDLSAYLHGIELVTVGGEAGREARVCDYDWVKHIREQCVYSNIRFWFKCTGSSFRKDGVLYKVNPYKQHSQAREAQINIGV